MVGGVLTSLGLVFSAFAQSLLHLYLGLGLLAGKKNGVPLCFRGYNGDRSFLWGRGRNKACVCLCVHVHYQSRSRAKDC